MKRSLEAAAEIGRYPAKNLELLLSRQLESVSLLKRNEYLEESELAELTKLVRAMLLILSNSIQFPQNAISTELTVKQMDLVLNIFVNLSYDKRPTALGCQNLLELLLKQILSLSHQLHFNSKLTENVRAMSRVLQPPLFVSDDDETQNKSTDKLVLQVVRHILSPLEYNSREYRVDQADNLHLLTRLINLSPDTLSPGQAHKVLRHIFDVLRRADRTSFTELDGTPCLEKCFTVLCISTGPSVPDEQYMHQRAFSCLRRWLEHLASSSDSPQKSQVVSDVGPHLQELVSRLLDQCERLSGSSAGRNNTELLVAVQLEAVELAALLCGLLPASVAHMSQRLRSMLTQPGHAQLSVRLLDCLVRHCSVMVPDPQTLTDEVFGKLLNSRFQDTLFVHHLMEYLLGDSERFINFTNEPFLLTRKLFPNLLKVVAWQPHLYLSDFVEHILPSAISSDTLLKVFYSVLDLPCLTACLEVRAGLNPDLEDPLRQQLVANYVGFVTRIEAGAVDTVDRMDRLHKPLISAESRPRVVGAALAVPVLLNAVFQAGWSLEGEDALCLKNLVPVILEGCLNLFGGQQLIEEVSQQMSGYVEKIVRRYPSLLSEILSQVMEFVSQSKHLQSCASRPVYLALLWSTGHVAAASRDQSDLMTTEQAAIIFETLECISYELMSETAQHLDARLWTCLGTAVAKVSVAGAAELLPRSILCITKMATQLQQLPSTAADYRMTCAHRRLIELVCLLRLPDVGAQILRPSERVVRGLQAHSDPTAMCHTVLKVAQLASSLSE